MAAVMGFLVTITTLPLASGWAMGISDTVRGLCAWQQFCSDCPLPPSCAGGVDPVMPPQRSPIIVTADLLADLPADFEDICLIRRNPLIQAVDPVTMQPKGEPKNIAASMHILHNGGGVLTVQCHSETPMFVQLEDCFTDTRHPAQMMEVVSILVFSGVLHQLPSRDGPTGKTDFEVEVHLSKVSPNSDGSYSSGCWNSRTPHRNPDLIVSFTMAPSAAMNAVDPSVVMRALDSIGAVSHMIATGVSTTVVFSDVLPLLPMEMSHRARAVRYNGSFSFPPCRPDIPRLVLTDVMEVPDIVGGIVAKASGTSLGTYQAYPYTLQTPGTVQYLRQSNAAGQVIDLSTEVGPNLKSLRYVVDAFIIINSFLFFYLVILLSARMGWIVIPPMLGGIGYKVDFYSQSYAEMKKMRNQGIFRDARGGRRPASLPSQRNDPTAYSRVEQISMGSTPSVTTFPSERWPLLRRTTSSARSGSSYSILADHAPSHSRRS